MMVFWFKKQAEERPVYFIRILEAKELGVGLERWPADEA